MTITVRLPPGGPQRTRDLSLRRADLGPWHDECSSRLAGRMLVTGEVQAAVSFTLAQVRLWNLARAGWLLSASQGAYRAGTVGLGPAEPPGLVPGMSRLVNVHSRDLAASGESAYMPLRWEAAGPGGELFPALDADITLSSAGDQATTLALVGVYRLPPGIRADELDRAAVRQSAAATIQAFLGHIAKAITVPAPAAGGNGGIVRQGGSRPPSAQAP
jgi:hypothetical protein